MTEWFKPSVRWIKKSQSESFEDGLKWNEMRLDFEDYIEYFPDKKNLDIEKWEKDLDSGKLTMDQFEKIRELSAFMKKINRDPQKEIEITKKNLREKNPAFVDPSHKDYEYFLGSLRKHDTAIEEETKKSLDEWGPVFFMTYWPLGG
jgi:hypothetical protein